MRLFLLIFSLLLSLCATSASAETAGHGTSSAALDSLLAATFDDIRASRLDSALESVNRLIAMRPDFKLAYLIKGDLLLSKARALPDIGAAPTSGKSLEDLRDEARVRLMRYVDQPGPDQLPAQILQLAPEQRYALLADASRARIYLFENLNGEPHLIHDFYLSVGKNGVGKQSEGDKRSPLGVYQFSAELSRSQLTPFYGAGAIPIEYPNDWDLQQGKSGHGIWLHGVPPDTYSRPPKTSEGCLVVANPDWQEIARYIRPNNTPLVIAERSEWLDRNAWLAKRQEVMGAIDSWKDDWQKRDATGFLSHYSPAMLGRLGKGWTEAKARNITQKSWIKVNLSDVSLFLYGNERIAVVNATQTYNSDKHNDVTRKKFYLQQESGQWHIAMEKTIQAGPAVASKD